MSVLLHVGGALEVDIIRGLAECDPAINVDRRCADGAELLAAARSGIGRIAVVRDWDLLVTDELHRLGLLVVGIADVEDPNIDPRRRGCDALASPYGSDVVACVRSLRESLSDRPAHAAGGEIETAPRTRASRSRARNRHAAPEIEVSDHANEDTLRRGRLIAVWGTPGSPGRSVVARDLAASLAASMEVCLIDGDTHAPSLAQLLGAEGETSALVACARRLIRGETGDILRESALALHGFDLIAGLNTGARWREVPRAACEELWRRARLGWEAIVVDCAAPCEEERGGGDRDAVTRSILTTADDILCVARATPVGIRRLITTLDEQERRGGTRPKVVLTSAPGLASADRTAIARILATKEINEITWIRADHGAFAQAEMRGEPLRDESPAAKDIAALARSLFGVIERGPAVARGGGSRQKRGRGLRLR